MTKCLKKCDALEHSRNSQLRFRYARYIARACKICIACNLISHSLLLLFIGAKYAAYVNKLYVLRISMVRYRNRLSGRTLQSSVATYTYFAALSQRDSPLNIVRS